MSDPVQATTRASTPSRLGHSLTAFAKVVDGIRSGQSSANGAADEKSNDRKSGSGKPKRNSAKENSGTTINGIFVGPKNDRYDTPKAINNVVIPGLAGDPELADSNTELDSEDIESVDTRAMSTSGDRIKLFNKVAVTTKDGQIYLVDHYVTPDLFEQATSLAKNGDAGSAAPAWSDTDIDRNQKRWLNRKSNEGFTVIESKADENMPADLGDIAYMDAAEDFASDPAGNFMPGMAITFNGPDTIGMNGNTAIFQNKDGKRFAVSEQYAPAAYKQLQKMHGAWQPVEDKLADGEYKLMSPDEDIPVLGDNDSVENITDNDGNVVKGVKIVHIDGEGDYVVLQSHTPEHYDSVTDVKLDRNQQKVDDVFKDHNLPVSSDTNVMQSETTETDEDGDAKTVSGLFIDSLEDKLEKRQQDDALKDTQETRDLEKYIKLLNLRSLLDDGGFQYEPYQTVDRGGDWTFYGSETKGMSAADLRSLINEDSVGKEIGRLLQKDAIKKISKDTLSDATDNLKNPDELVKTIYDSLTGKQGDAYLQALDELKADGLGEEAQTRLNNDLQALQKLDPDKADKVRGIIAAKSTAMDLGDSLKNIDAENSGTQPPDANTDQRKEQIADDILTTILPSITYTTFGIQTTSGVWTVLQSGGSVDAKTGLEIEKLTKSEQRALIKIQAVKKILKPIIMEQAGAGTDAKVIEKASGKLKEEVKSGKLPKLVAKAEQQLKEDKLLPKDTKLDFGKEEQRELAGSIRKGFDKLLDSQKLLTIGGVAALTNAIYKRSGGAGEFGDTAEERMSVARGMLVFISTVPSAMVTLSPGLEKLFKMPDMINALGLDPDSNLGDVFKERFPKAESGSDRSSSPAPDETDSADAGDKNSDGSQPGDDRSSTSAEAGPANADDNNNSDGSGTTDADGDTFHDAPEQPGTSHSGDAPDNNAFYDAPETPNEYVHEQITAFNNNVEELNDLLSSRTGGKMSADKVLGLVENLRNEYKDLSEYVDSNPALSDTERSDLRGSLNTIKQSLEKLDDAEDGRSIPANADDAVESLRDSGSNLETRFDPKSRNSVTDPFHGFTNTLDAVDARAQGTDGPVMSGALPADAESPSPGSDSHPSNAPDIAQGEHANGGDNNDGDKKKTNPLGPALKGVAAMSDFGGGILDVTLAGMGLDQAIKSGDDLAIANNSVALGSGTAFTVGGAAEVLGAFGSGLRVLGPIGNVIGIGLGLASLIMTAVMKQKRGAQKEADVREQFQQYADYGVTESDWGKKLNYLINSSYAMDHMNDTGIGGGDDSDQLHKEWFPGNIPAWEAQPEQYEKFTREIEGNGNIPEKFFWNDMQNMRLNIHGQQFYQDNKNAIDIVLNSWDDWNGSDDIVSDDDLRVIVDEGDSKEQRDAAQFMLDHKDFVDLLDTLHEGGEKDGKISSADLDSWMQLIGERKITENNPAFERGNEDSHYAHSPAAWGRG